MERHCGILPQMGGPISSHYKYMQGLGLQKAAWSLCVVIGDSMYSSALQEKKIAIPMARFGAYSILPAN